MLCCFWVRFSLFFRKRLLLQIICTQLQIISNLIRFLLFPFRIAVLF